jgi:hypothetical protein
LWESPEPPEGGTPNKGTVKLHLKPGPFSACFFRQMGFIVGMTIWILALVLVGSAAALGYRQGVIRVAFSFVGIIFAAMLAVPLAKLFRPILTHLGVQNDLLVWALAPLLAFVPVLLVFKSVGFAVHRKVELHYKYKRDDLAEALWERLSRRVGFCLGTLNGTAYLALICFGLFNLSYWTVQIAGSDAQDWKIRLVNRLGRDMQSTGMNRVARAVGTLPADYYQLADLAGLVVQNSQLSDRLARYPAFLSLRERDDFKQLGGNSDFQHDWSQQAPIGQLINNDQFKAIWQNRDTVSLVRGVIEANYDDLYGYLQTGQSPKYDPDKFLGSWNFNPPTTTALVPIAQPKISLAQMRFIRVWMTNYQSTTLVISPDHKAFLHNVPHIKSSSMGPTATLHLWPILVFGFRNGSVPATEMATLTGQWQIADDTAYTLSFDNSGQPDSMNVQLKQDRLTITTADGDTLVFDRGD